MGPPLLVVSQPLCSPLMIFEGAKHSDKHSNNIIFKIKREQIFPPLDSSSSCWCLGRQQAFLHQLHQSELSDLYEHMPRTSELKLSIPFLKTMVFSATTDIVKSYQWPRSSELKLKMGLSKTEDTIADGVVAYAAE